jgi:N-acetylglucosamine-6-phosphate deacetylase
MVEALNKSVLLRGARTIVPARTIEPGAVLIEAGRIARVFDSGNKLPAADSVIDLDGFTLFPGFIDLHIHGAVGVDTMDAGAEDLCRVAEFLARNGVTAWLPTLVPAQTEQYEQAVNAITKLIEQQESKFAPSALNADGTSTPAGLPRRGPGTSALPAKQSRVIGVHYEGPFVNSEQCGALHREHFRNFTGPIDIDALPTIRHDGATHMMTLAPEIDDGIELIRELRKRGWVVSIGHTRATVEILDRALSAGASHMTHFMNAMAPLHHRAPGPIGWGLMHDDVTCDVIADGVHLDPAILKLILRTKTAGRVSLISDAIAAAGLGDGEYHTWGEKIVVTDGRTQNTHGSIAGSVITMLDAVRMMLSLGVSEPEVARMASLNPARLLGLDDDFGSIEEGKRADLVAVDEERNVRLTIIDGRVVS